MTDGKKNQGNDRAKSTMRELLICLMLRLLQNPYSRLDKIYYHDNVSHNHTNVNNNNNNNNNGEKYNNNW